jgi:hypothetical protein
MKKRSFLAAAAAAASLPAFAQSSAAKALQGPVLLTVTGKISKPNRAAYDPVFDQMMGKQKIAFEKAHVFDFAALAALPATTINPTIEYDKKKHALRGPLLADVLKAAGAADTGKVAMRAIDGYAPTITIADARKLGFIVATHLDGKPMPLGGLGPLWAVYEPDRFPEWASKPIDQRFANCPWGLYHIDVQAA